MIHLMKSKKILDEDFVFWHNLFSHGFSKLHLLIWNPLHKFDKFCFWHRDFFKTIDEAEANFLIRYCSLSIGLNFYSENCVLSRERKNGVAKAWCSLVC